MSDQPTPEKSPFPPRDPETTITDLSAESTSPFIAGTDMDNVLRAEPTKYTRQLAVIYTILGVILAVALAGLIALVGRPGASEGPPWSTWTPKNGSAANMSQQIADRVAAQYRTAEDGGPLVAVTQGPPVFSQVVNNTSIDLAIKAIAVRKQPESDVGIRILNDTSKTRLYTLCGLGQDCAINGGTPSAQRGRLIRREALEAALYTFKYVPSVDTVLAYLPPAPGATVPTLLFLEKDKLKDQLDQPLSQTLPLATPPLPDSENLAEATTIDKLTLKNVFSFQYAMVPTGGAWIILDPAG